MQLQVKGRNLEVSDAIDDYAREKIRKLERQLHDAARVEVELAVERNPSIAASHVAEATVWTKGPVLRARESSHDMRASIDQLADKLERQIKRYREKRRRRPGRSDGASREAAPAAVGETEPRIVKMKRYPVNPMTPEEAVLQLELIGHDFFFFRNAESSELNVVYRRREGGYGLIEPQA